MTLDVAGLVEHVMKAWLLLYLCQDSIALREKYHSIGKRSEEHTSELQSQR